jgi:hypothetical protein
MPAASVASASAVELITNIDRAAVAPDAAVRMENLDIKGLRKS